VIALDVKSTIYVTSAESAEVQMSALADHRNKCRMSQVLFEKGIAIPPRAENVIKRMDWFGICCRSSTGQRKDSLPEKFFFN